MKNAKTAKSVKSVKSVSLVTDLSLFAADKAAKEFYALLCEAHVFNDSMRFYDEAKELNDYYNLRKSLTAKERNALKRKEQKKECFSEFASCRKESQAAQIEALLTDFISYAELFKQLKHIREARIKNHVSYLKTVFRKSVVYEEKYFERTLKFRFTNLLNK